MYGLLFCLLERKVAILDGTFSYFLSWVNGQPPPSKSDGSDNLPDFGKICKMTCEKSEFSAEVEIKMKIIS